MTVTMPRMQKVVFLDHIRVVDAFPGDLDKLAPSVVTIYGEVFRETELYLFIMASQTVDAPGLRLGGPRNMGWLILKGTIVSREDLDVAEAEK